jgi:hypothetical protein
MKKLLLLSLIFGAVLFFGAIKNANADCASCMQDCYNLNANAPEIPTDCDEYCAGQCSVNETCNSPDICKASCGNDEHELVGPFDNCSLKCCEQDESGEELCNSPDICKASCGNDEHELVGPFDNCSLKCCEQDDTEGDEEDDTPGDTLVKCDTSNFNIIGGVCFPKNTGLSETPIATILKNLLTWILYIFGLLAIAAFVISGIQYLVAAGNEEKIKTAKRNMQWSLVGVIVALSAFVIIKAIAALLQATPGF